MPGPVTMDVSNLNQFIVELDHVRARSVLAVERVVERGALGVKNRMVADAQKSKHFGQIARTISYDSATQPGVFKYEIGPDRDRGDEARIANIAYFGGRFGGGNTLDVEAGLNEEEPRLLAHLSELARGIL